MSNIVVSKLEKEIRPSNGRLPTEDWRNREKWQWYEEAVNEMPYRTDTLLRSWTVIEANNKEYARLKVFKTMLDRYEKVLKDKGATK